MPINNGGTGKYTEMKVFNTTITDNVKYNKPKELDGIQEDPKKMKVEHFKQDYVVMIRKKLYYASSSVSDEYYLRLYQLNNFSSVRTSISTSGRSGSCSVVIKGGERVVCAERPQEEAKAWSSYEEMLNGWANIDDEGIDGTYDSRFEGKERIWRVGNDDWADKNAKGIDYKNVMKAREHKYGWKFAEKCDFEPMDELIVFGKSRSKRRNTKKNEFEMQPIFFGYIDSIQKTYQAGKGGLQINISASDHLKLLELGKVINSPSLIPGKFSGNGIDLRYNVDEFGCFVINDPFSDIKSGVKTAEDISEYYAFSNVFAGKYPYEIISNLKHSLEASFEKDGVFGVLNTAADLYSHGEKGAYKYALKYIKDKPLIRDDLYVIIPTLINIMLIDPRYGKYVTRYLKKNLNIIRYDTLTQVFNKELSCSLENQLQQESLLFVQIIRELDLTIDGLNIIKILNSDNDFAIIIALDIWKNHNKHVIRTKSEAMQINKSIKDLLFKLKGEKFNGSRWLLLYEIIANDLVKEEDKPEVEMTEFFQKMLDLNVSFYNPK